MDKPDGALHDFGDTFARRHIGPDEPGIAKMLEAVGFENVDALIDATVPKNIRLERSLDLPAAKSESEALAELRAISKKNKVLRSYLGVGYSDCITPPVIQRNILENPGWYTAYTPYQAEIAQGRLEALVNFQTMITDLTALEIANASMLDEATSAAEAERNFSWRIIVIRKRSRSCARVRNRSASKWSWEISTNLSSRIRSSGRSYNTRRRMARFAITNRS